MVLLLKNLLFTLLVPDTVAVYVPCGIARGQSLAAGFHGAFGWSVLAAGAVLYAWCVYGLAVVGHGTPAPIDAPTTIVIPGP